LAFGLSEALIVEEILHQAEQSEIDYDWLAAVRLYEKALSLLPQDDFSKMGEVNERRGNALYRFAFQAENKDEFRDRLRQSAAGYERATGYYVTLKESVKTARTSRCNAMLAYIGYWLETEAQEKKKKIDECWKLAKGALDGFKEAGEEWEYGRTYAQLSNSVVFTFCLEWNFEARKKMVKEAVDTGEQAIKFLSTEKKTVELAKAYARTAFYVGVFDYYFLDIDEKERDLKKAQDYWANSKEISEETALFELLFPIFGGTILLWGEQTDATFANLQKALEYGRKTKDKFIIGCAFDWLVYHTAWTGARISGHDQEGIGALRKAVLGYAEETKRQYSPISFVSPRGDNVWVESADAECVAWGAFYETDLKKRRELFEKRIEFARKGLVQAEIAKYPETMVHANHVLSASLSGLAFLPDTTLDEKKKLLEEAIVYRNEAVKNVEIAQPLEYWNRGIQRFLLASVKNELADLTTDLEMKRGMIEETLKDMEKGLQLCIKELPLMVKQGPPLYYVAIARGQYRLGECLIRLFKLTHNAEQLRKAVKFFADASESAEKVESKEGVALCYWKIAQTYDDLSDHLKAAENFDIASDNYRSEGKKTPQLKSFCEEYARYMQAWSEIERARHHHSRQEYGLAKPHFEKAGDLHRSMKKWGYLAPNYFAWVQVEDGEDLSRKECTEAAINAFKQAINLFTEAKTSLEAQLGKVEDSDEKQMAVELIKATDVRKEYCIARLSLEQARKMDKEGDHYSSSEKYRSAAMAFEKTYESVDSDQDKREMKFAITLSQAWQKMTLAEAKSSPALYLEASQLFEQTEDLSSNEKTKMLVLGHSRFCRALEAGTKYADTRDRVMYRTAVQHLASASNYYIRADFQNASEYAKATKLLFDAYAYMDDAERESDPNEKTRFYAMVEKVLQTSAGSFTKAEHPEKREQVLRLLDKARDEKELAASLTEVMHAPSIVSATRVLTAPTPTHEEAVGSERFEHADIQANLIVHSKEVKIGESFSLELEFVNAGKAPALLIRVNEAIPEGFDLVEKPETCRVEDSYINMKGRRLDSLKAEELKLVFRPKVQGTFCFKPTILYLDENGKYKSHEPESVTIIVKELGVKGWLKGER
jgi:tetratricopeptide (TPR) repeat protein